MKSGEMKLSFGMIFSIFLIIVFLAFAFYVIPKFLDLQENITTKKFIDDFQNDVDKMWKSTQGSQEIEYSVPSGIEKICFRDSELYFKPIGVGGNSDYTKIEHLDVADDFCVKSSDGRIKMTIKKDFNEVLVRIG